MSMVSMISGMPHAQSFRQFPEARRLGLRAAWFAYDVPIRSMPSRWDVPSIPTQTHKTINNVRSVEPWELAKVTESRAKKEEVLALEI
jgi:hypothetical protein